MQMLKIFESGGFAMYPLAIFSLIVWFVALHKYILVKQFIRQYHFLIKNGVSEKYLARGFYQEILPYLREMFLLLEQKNIIGKENFELQISRKLQLQNLEISRGLWILATVASTAPFIGLFGTVTGIIKSFDAIALSGKSGFSIVAGGLSEALITTATGIIVAVCAIVLFNYLQNLIKVTLIEFKLAVEDKLDQNDVL